MSNISSNPRGNDSNSYQDLYNGDQYTGYSVKIVKDSDETRKPKGSSSPRTYATVQSQVVVTDKEGRHWRLNFESEVDITTNDSARQIFDQLKAMKSLAKNMTAGEIHKYFKEGAEFKVMNASTDWDKPAHLTFAWKKADASEDAAFQRLCIKTKKIYTSNELYEPHFTYDLKEQHLSSRGWMKLIDKETEKAKAEGPENPNAKDALKTSAKGIFRGTKAKVQQLIGSTISSLPYVKKKIPDMFPSLKVAPERHKISAQMADAAFKAYRESLQIPDIVLQREEPAPPDEEGGAAPAGQVPGVGDPHPAGDDFEHNEPQQGR